MRFQAWTIVVVSAAVAGAASGQQADPGTVPPLQLFFAASSLDECTSKAALDALAPQWKDSYASRNVDLARLLRPAGVMVEESSAARFSGGGFDDGLTAPALCGA